jgi:hypothetical protein
MTVQSGVKANDAAVLANAPRRSRLRLDTMDRIRREVTRLYREGRDGERDTQDVSRLANVLALIARMIEGGQLEARIAALEAAAKEQR